MYRRWLCFLERRNGRPLPRRPCTKQARDSAGEGRARERSLPSARLTAGPENSTQKIQRDVVVACIPIKTLLLFGDSSVKPGQESFFSSSLSGRVPHTELLCRGISIAPKSFTKRFFHEFSNILTNFSFFHPNIVTIDLVINLLNNGYWESKPLNNLPDRCFDYSSMQSSCTGSVANQIYLAVF